MPLHEGENVGPYRVIGQLGQGGMATVYKAFHAQLNRFVAIKMMHTAFQDNENFHARFRREAQIVALLEHPHIVPVYDFNEYQNQPYLVMKFIEGKTLKGTLVDGALTLKQVLHVMTAVASALTYAHTKGVLHRDIKPSNIVIDNENVPYLTDFGLARIAEAGESTLSADMILGTPHYISPEQALGEKNLTSRTDIYSLGVVLYELVVGRVPFSADTPYAIIHDHIYTPLPLPSRVNPDLPPEVELVLLKALAKDPQDRYETAVEMVEAFKGAITSTGLSELKADRVSNAGVSLAKMRIEMASQIIAGSTLDVPGISSPMLAPTPSQLLRQRQRERRWMWGGLASALLICALSGFVTLNALNTLDHLRDGQPPVSVENATPRPTVPASSPTSVPVNNNPPPADLNGDGPRPVPRLTVPDLTLEEAQAAVDANPNVPESYLALAQAYLEDGQRDEARTAFQNGLSLVRDPIPYLMTAGDISRDTGHAEIAIILYAGALEFAQNGQDPATAASAHGPFNPIRNELGEYLYQLTEDPATVDFPAITLALNGQFADIDATFIDIFAARDMLQEGRTRLAIARLATLASGDNAFSEAHLVYAEALIEQGQTDNAREQLALIQQDAYAPVWLRDRAAELTSTIEG